MLIDDLFKDKTAVIFTSMKCTHIHKLAAHHDAAMGDVDVRGMSGNVIYPSLAAALLSLSLLLLP